MKDIPNGAKVLHLTLTRHWFDQIASGEKKEDFREIKDYWVNRLAYTYDTFHDLECEFADYDGDTPLMAPIGEGLNHSTKFASTNTIKHFDLVTIRAGYQKNAPTLTARCTGIRITADDEQTDLGVGRFFAIGIGDVLKRWNINE